MYPALSQLYVNAVLNWRSTAKGLLSATIAVVVAVAALPPDSRRTVYVLAALRALVGLLETDCGGSCK